MAVGYDADYTLVDLKARRRMDADWLASKCGWSPFEGREVTGWPVGTIIRGAKVMWDGDVLGDPASAPIRFWETLTADQ